MVDVTGEYLASPPTLSDRQQQKLRLSSTGALVVNSEGGEGDASAAKQDEQTALLTEIETTQDDQLTQETLINTRLGDITSPAAGTVNARLATLNTTLGSPFQAGGSIGNTSFAISGTLPAFASTPTVNAIGTKLNDGTQSSTGGTHLTVGGVDTGTNVYRPALVDSSGRLQVVPTGNVASGATDSGNPLKMGGVNRTTRPTLTDGQRSDAHVDTRGAIFVTLSQANSTSSPVMVTAASDTNTAANVALQVSAYNLVYDAAGSNMVRQRGDTGGTVTQPYATTGSRWTYAAAAGGISNTTTAVTIAAAAGASLRNYVTSIQLNSTALGAATEIAIRDGAGGTVLWRSQIGTAGLVDTDSIVFPVPLKGTANTLMEVVTLTATVTGAVYFNAQGYTAA